MVKNLSKKIVRTRSGMTLEHIELLKILANKSEIKWVGILQECTVRALQRRRYITYTNPEGSHIRITPSGLDFLSRYKDSI